MLELELWESYYLMTLLKVGVGFPFLVKSPLMEVLNIWEFLSSTRPVGPFGVPISWLPIFIVEMVVPVPIRTGKFNLGDLMEVFLSCDMVLSLTVRLAPPGVHKTRSLLRAASTMITFEVGVWRACGFALPAAIPFGICGSIGMVMIGRVRLINNFCGEFLLVMIV